MGHVGRWFGHCTGRKWKSQEGFHRPLFTALKSPSPWGYPISLSPFLQKEFGYVRSREGRWSQSLIDPKVTLKSSSYGLSGNHFLKASHTAPPAGLPMQSGSTHRSTQACVTFGFTSFPPNLRCLSITYNCLTKCDINWNVVMKTFPR